MTRRPASKRPPIDHTVVINTPAQMLDKLAWDIDVFDDIQRRAPDEKQPLAYAAINVCIAAESLRNWAERELVSFSRLRGADTDRASVLADIHRSIPHQRICDAVANTSKHAGLHEEDWEGGTVRMIWDDPSEDDPGGFSLQHDGPNGKVSAHANFTTLLKDWRDFLLASGLVKEPIRLPDWQQHKLRRLFGRALPMDSDR